ncbi:hypothetical protein LAZ67_20000559, partial [Cordylochernes scorpioides]
MIGKNLFLLQSAIGYNDSKRVEELIESGIDINCQNKWGMSTLHIAVDLGRTEILRNLIRKNADINIQNSLNKTPLHFAVLGPNDKSYLHLIQAGASLNIKDNQGDTPLHLSIKNKYLLELGVEVNFKGPLGKTALHHASAEWINPKKGKLMKLLIEFGADVNSRSYNGTTPLMNIARNGKIFEAQMLIKAGASINAKVLLKAIEGGNIETTRLLINLGANVNSADMFAAKYLNINILKILVESKADIYLKNNSGLIPLAYTVRDNSFLAWSEVVSGLKYLLQATRDFDLKECVDSNIGLSKSIKMMVKYFVLYHPRSSLSSAVSSEEMLSSWWDSCQREMATILDHKLGQITLHSYLVEPDLNTRAGYLYNENSGIQEHLEWNMTWYKDNLQIYSSMIEEYYKEDIKR